MEAEVIFESRVHGGKHLDVGARGEELVARPGEQEHVNVIVHARPQDGILELPHHFIGIGVGRRVVHLDYRHARVGAVVDQLLGGFCAYRLDCGCHMRCSFENSFTSLELWDLTSALLAGWNRLGIRHAGKYRPSRAPAPPRLRPPADYARCKSSSSCRTGSARQCDWKILILAPASAHPPVPGRCGNTRA